MPNSEYAPISELRLITCDFGIWNAYCKHAFEAKILRMHIPSIHLLLVNVDNQGGDTHRRRSQSCNRAYRRILTPYTKEGVESLPYTISSQVVNG